MKPIKISEPNRAAIEAALAKVNGKATSHTFTGLGDILDVVARADRALDECMVAKSRRAGARFHATSGGGVANAYKYSRIGTHIVIEHQARGWALVSVSQATLYAHALRVNLTLTQDQAAEAVANFSKRFTVFSAQATEPSPQP